MKEVFESLCKLFKVLDRGSRIALIIGVVIILILVGLNPPAGGVLIGFLAALFSIFRGGEDKSKSKSK
jgi:hypothetical protein